MRKYLRSIFELRINKGKSNLNTERKRKNSSIEENDDEINENNKKLKK